MPRYSEKQRAALDALMRDDVYRHAVAIIAAEGLQGLTLDRLAKDIGVSRGTLYNYFADRDAIVELVEVRTFDPLLESIEEIAAGDSSPPEMMKAIASEIFAGVYDNRTLVVALSPEKHKGSQPDFRVERRNRLMAIFREIVQRGIDSGVFREVPTDLAGEIIFSCLAGLVDNMALGGVFRKPDEIVPALMEIILGGLKR